MNLLFISETITETKEKEINHNDEDDDEDDAALDGPPFGNYVACI